MIHSYSQVRGARNDEEDDTGVPQDPSDPAWMASSTFLIHNKYIRKKEEKARALARKRNPPSSHKKSSKDRRARQEAIERAARELAAKMLSQQNEEKVDASGNPLPGPGINGQVDENESDSDESKPPTPPPPGVRNPVAVAIERLLNLEASIEKRYVRHKLDVLLRDQSVNETYKFLLVYIRSDDVKGRTSTFSQFESLYN